MKTRALHDANIALEKLFQLLQHFVWDRGGDEHELRVRFHRISNRRDLFGELKAFTEQDVALVQNHRVDVVREHFTFLDEPRHAPGSADDDVYAVDESFNLRSRLTDVVCQERARAKPPKESCFTTSRTCVASSLVGVKTKSRGFFDLLRPCSTSIFCTRCSSGNKYANVFPLPA